MVSRSYRFDIEMTDIFCGVDLKVFEVIVASKVFGSAPQGESA